MNSKINDPAENRDCPQKIADYFKSLRNIKPKLENKNTVIERLIDFNNKSAAEPSILLPAIFFLFSIILVIFSSYLAYDTLNHYNMETKEAISLTVTPTFETVSKNIESSEPAVSILISLSFFCFIMIFFLTILSGAILYFYNSYTYFLHSYKSYVL